MIRWFFSKAVREAVAMRKHVWRLLNAQRDLLSSQAIAAVQGQMNELNAAIAEGNKGRIRIRTEELQFAAEKWIKSYPNPAWRENVEVLLVALAVAMGIRTFFLQPFKIPTGSMQPTLFGVTSAPDFSKVEFWRDSSSEVEKTKVQSEINEQAKLRNSIQIPSGLQRIKDWFAGKNYIHVVAQADGVEESISPPTRFLIFNIYQTIKIGGQTQTIWFPPDYGEQPLETRAGFNIPLAGGRRLNLYEGHVFHKGEDVIKMEISAGDHLFVNRLTYNFRKPTRGEIVVFETHGIETMPLREQNTFYIKRLVVMPGERVQIGDDRHAIINGQRLDASTPHFQNVYGFDPKEPPSESQFSGHVNGAVAEKYDLYPFIAPLFPDAQTVFTNGDDSYMVFGDNTCNSFDGRSWGSFPAKNVIGKSFFVYWPITSRFGWGNQ
ncbi:MAG TPA: signal peptidase I [Verrucomicrobiae bacterium]|nr:signal peptidase I [Verrucomicrobiae bacterium]